MQRKNNNTTVILIVILVVVIAAIMGIITWGLFTHMGSLTDVFHRPSAGEEAETVTEEKPVAEDITTETVAEHVAEAKADVQDAILYLSAVISGEAVPEKVAALTPDAAMELIRQTAGEDTSAGCLCSYLCGLLYWQGNAALGIDTDRTEGAGFLQQAAAFGYPDAMLRYARVSFVGDLLPAERNVRVEARGDGNAYLSYQVYQNFEESRKYYTGLLAAGDDLGISDEVKAESAYSLGCMFLYGMCVKQDGKVAATYFEKASELGYGVPETLKAAASSVGGDGEKEDIVGGEARYAKASFSDAEMQAAYDKIKESLEKTDTTAAEMNADLAELIQAPAAPAGTETLYGLHDWLFYQSVTDGKSVRDYLREEYLSDSQKKEILDNLIANDKLVKEKNPDAQLVVVIIPNKEIVYAENMPEYLTVANEKTRAEDLIEYLEANNCPAKLIYTKEEMLKYKEDHQLYYRTDTHCNMKGAYVTLSAIMSLYGKSLDLNTAVFNSNQELYAGDLAADGKLMRTARYQSDFVYNLLPNEIPEEQKVDEGSVLIIGDSFSTFLDMMGLHFFRDDTKRFMCPMVNAYDYSYNLAMEYLLPNRDADYVVWECAERHLQRLKGTNY